MRTPTSISLLAATAAALALSACSDSDSPTVPPPTLSGTLTLPNLAAGSGEEFDGDAFHARDLGTFRGSLHISGRVGSPDVDALDVLRVGVPEEAVTFRVTTADADGVALHLIEASTGRLLLRVRGNEPAVVSGATTLDLVVEAVRGEHGYVLTAHHADPQSDVAVELPLGAGRPELRTTAQARYLGAHHEMVPGEVVVLLDTQALDGAGFDATAAGLAPAGTAADGTDLRLYRLAAVATATLESGAPLEHSLETETCLAARRIEAMPGVRAASPNFVRRALATVPNDPHYALQWHYQVLRMELAWDLEQGSTDVVVGVADTGIVSAHPDFSGRLINGFDFISDPSRALDGDGVDPDAEDPGDLSNFPNSSWHGTHVAGTIGARTNDGVGVAGMDWNCRLMPLRVLGRNGGTSLDIMEAVRYAAGLANVSGAVPQVPRGRVDVLNMSLGGGGGSSTEEAVYAQVRNAGVLVVCAAGNDGTVEPQFPASYPTNVSVGAVRFDLTRAFYSNQATTVDVMAPGGDVTVDQTGDEYADGVLSCSANHTVGAPLEHVYVFEMGTSMASPHVAGLASLLIASRPTATPEILEQLIVQNTRDLGAPGVDPVFRSGLIDPLAAIRAAQNNDPNLPILAASPLAVTFGTADTTAPIDLSNIGDQNQQLQVTGATIDPPSATWLSASLVPSQQPSITHSRLDLAVDRTGLPDGSYTATVTITSANAAPVQIPVTMQVGTTIADEILYVLLVDVDELATVAQTATTRQQNYAWTLVPTATDPIADDAYLLVAGTDRDSDDFIGDEGELFGVWPLADSPEPIVIDPAARVHLNLDFPVSPVTQLSAARERGYRRLW